MPAPLEYDFRVVGMQTVKAALRNVERDVTASIRRIRRAGGQSATGRLPAGSGLTGRRGSPRGGTSLADWAERDRHRQAMRNFQTESRERQKDVRRENRSRMRALKNRLRERKREEARSESRAIATAKARATTRAGLVGTAGRSAVNTVRGIGRFAVMSAGLMGGFAAGGAIRNAQMVETASVQLANQAYRPGGTESRKEIAEQVRATARTVGAESGLGAEGIIAAMRQFVAISGDVSGAMGMARYMADIADASGADISDVGRSAGQIQQGLIMARGMSSEEAMKQTEDMLAAMAGQAKVGSIEFADLAQQMGKLVSSTARFSGEASELVSTMGAVSQLAIAGAASSPEEAMTAILRFSDDIVQNAKAFKAAGVDVFTDKTQTKLRKPEEILTEIVGATRGNLAKIKGAFGIRAQKAVAPFQTIYTEASQAAGGGKAGHEAGMKAMTNLLESVRGVKMTATEIRGSARAARQTSEKQWAMAMEKFNQAVGTELLPVVTKLVPKFAALVPHMATAAKWLGRFADELARNPLGTLGKIIAAKVALDIAGAGIGAATRSAIKAAMMRAELGSAAAGMAGGLHVSADGRVTRLPSARSSGPQMMGLGRGAYGVIAGAMTAALTGVTLGVIVKEAVEVSLVKGWHENEDTTNKLMREGQEAISGGTTEERKKVQEKIQTERDKLEKQGTLMKTARLAATGGFGSDDNTWYGKLGYALANPLGAAFGAATPMQEVENEVVGKQVQALDATSKKLAEAEINTGAFLAAMDAATMGNEQFLTSINALSANFTKLGEAAAKASGNVGTPNTGDSPTVPKS